MFQVIKNLQLKTLAQKLWLNKLHSDIDRVKTIKMMQNVTSFESKKADKKNKT